MKTLKVLSLVILLLAIAWTAADRSGMIEQINNMIHQKDGWVKIDNGYAKSEIEAIHIISIALLNDPEKEKLNIYQGTMKKSAVDRMELITIIGIQLSENKIETLNAKITELVTKYKCNTAIINGSHVLYRTKFKSLPISFSV